MRIHPALLEALQPHPCADATSIFRNLASSFTLNSVGSTRNEQDGPGGGGGEGGGGDGGEGGAGEGGAGEGGPGGGAAACVTLNRSPAAVMTPVRATPVPAVTANSTAPVPLPEAPDRMTIQGESDEAVHAHNELDARTSNAPLPPVGPKLFEGSDNE